MDTYFIYALGDPRDGELRYVGCTNNPARRQREYAGMQVYNNDQFIRWLRELKNINQQPVLVCLRATNDYENAGSLEVEMMTRLRQEGHRLLNRNQQPYRRWDMAPSQQRKRRRRALHGSLHNHPARPETLGFLPNRPEAM